jgi:hypothetical protein
VTFIDIPRSVQSIPFWHCIRFGLFIHLIHSIPCVSFHFIDFVTTLHLLPRKSSRHSSEKVTSAFKLDFDRFKKFRKLSSLGEIQQWEQFGDEGNLFAGIKEPGKNFISKSSLSKDVRQLWFVLIFLGVNLNSVGSFNWVHLCESINRLWDLSIDCDASQWILNALNSLWDPSINWGCSQSIVWYLNELWGCSSYCEISQWIVNGLN